MRKPLYIQMGDKLRELILSGEHKYGEMFPSERELETTYGLDRKTIRKSLNILVDEGLLIHVKGKGNYVNSPDIDFSVKTLSGLGRLMEFQGIQSKTKEISSSKEPAGYHISKMMRVEKSEEIWKLIRVRYADSRPIAFEITYVRADLIPDFEEIDFGVYSLYDMMIQNGHTPTKVSETIDAVQITGIAAKYLEKEEGDTVFLIQDITEDQNGVITDYCKTYTNSDRIKLSTRLS